jgi:hypothetical protein
VRLPYETLTQYFSCSCGNGTDSRKSAVRHIMLNFFLHPLGSVGHIVYCSASGAQNIDALFFLLGWHLYGFHKKHVGAPYAKFVFLHFVLSAGHVVHSGASGARNIDALFFMLRRDWSSFHKKHNGTSYIQLVFLHLVGYAGHVTNSGASRT